MTIKIDAKTFAIEILPSLAAATEWLERYELDEYDTLVVSPSSVETEYGGLVVVDGATLKTWDAIVDYYGESNEWGGTGYPTTQAAVENCIEIWLTANGANNEADVRDALDGSTDAQLIEEMVDEGWYCIATIADHVNAMARARAKRMSRLTITADPVDDNCVWADPDYHGSWPDALLVDLPTSHQNQPTGE
jgi:hypothetical protein